MFVASGVVKTHGRDRPSRPAFPSNIIGTRDTIDIIDTRAAIDVFQPAPFGIVSILDAFYIRDEISLCTT